MRLIAATLTNYRGISQATIHFGDTVTVVEGPNEAGKSSIAEALRMLRLHKATSSKQAIRALQPVGRDVGPSAAVELRTGPYHLTYSKRWLKSPETVLNIHAPTPEQLTGDAAHDRFLAILDETVNTDLLTALDVAQGQSLDQAALAHIPALQRALGDGEESPHDADGLMTRVDEEYFRYFTATGRPSKEYRALQERIEELTALVEGLEVRSVEMDQLTDRHRRAVQRRDELDSQALDIDKMLHQARADIQAVSGLRQALQDAQRTRRDAHRELDDTRAVLEAREHERRSIAELAQEISALQSRKTEGTEEQARAQELLAVARRQYDEAQSAHRSTLEAISSAQQALRVAEAGVALAEAQKRLRKVEAAQTQRDAAHASLSQETITHAIVEQLRELAIAAQIARRTRDAAAPKICVTQLGEQPVEVGGEGLPHSPFETTVRDALDVTVPGVVRVNITAGRGAENLSDKLQHAEEALATALAMHGVESLAAAEDALVRRDEATRALDHAESVLESRLDGATHQELRDRVTELTALAGNATELSVADAEALLAQLEESRAAQRQAEEAQRELLEEAQRREMAADHDLMETTVRLDSATTQHERALARLGDDEATVAQRLIAAQRAKESADTAVAHAEAALLDADVEMRELRLSNAEALQKSHAETRAQQRDRVTELKTLLDAQIAEGLYEQLAEARAELEADTQAWHRLHRSAQAVALLRSTLHAHRDAAQARYVAPFTDRINHLGRTVFGRSFGVQVSDDLHISARTLDGVTVPFLSLSVGAREQLALIGRLAVAQLIDESEGAPILLDDALGFADPQRLEHLNLVLADVGGSAQIVVLTCQPARFDMIGGALRQQLG